MTTLDVARSHTSVQLKSTRTHKVLAWIGIALGRLAVLLISLILCLPVLIAPITTAIPSWAGSPWLSSTLG